MKKTTLTFLVLNLFFSIRILAQDCVSDLLIPTKWNTGIASELQSSLSWTQADNVNTNFHGIWIHSAWKNNFGPCALGSPWTTPANFQTVIDAGKIPVVYYWWHSDHPENIALRTEAQQQLHDCLIPLLNQINRPTKEVWIVLQPEYNMNGVPSDGTFATHLIAMIDDLKLNVTGVKIKVGPCAGNFGTMEERYRLHASLQGVIAKSDFIGFHDIQRNAPTVDAIYTYPVPGQTKSTLSFCRFLSKEYNKPLFFAYWTVNNSYFGQTAQSDALKDIFNHQAEYHRYGVMGFGPFWYKDDNGFPGEGLKTNGNSAYPVWSDYKTIVNGISSNTTYRHSISFLDLDYGQNITLPITLRWVSRGRTGTITYSIYYQVNGGSNVLIASGLTGNANEVMQLKWDPCNFPTTPVMNFVVIADDLVQSVSPKVSYNSSQSSSNATFNFENGNITSFAAVTAGVTLASSSTAASSGTKSLQVNLATNGSGWSILKLNGPLAYTGSNTIEMMIYVPYSLNNTMEMGSEVTYCTFYMQTNSTWSNFNAPSKIGLNQGWNKVTWNYTLNGGDPQNIYLLEIRLWNRMAVYNDLAKIFIDDLKIGGSNTYSFPTNSCTSTATPLSYCSLSLPLNLISFTGKRINERSVELDWSCLPQNDSYYFIVERSIDNGYTTQEISKVDGNNNLSEYFYIDSIGEDRAPYYRLKQVTLGGPVNYSNWISLESRESIKFKISPNPTTEYINLNSELGSNKEYTVTINNMLGETLYTCTGSSGLENHFTRTIDVKNLPPAVYFVYFTHENKREIELLVKQ